MDTHTDMTSKDAEIAELKKQLAISNKKNALYEARRAKRPLQRYVIHRCFAYEFVKSIEAHSYIEAKDIANLSSLQDVLEDKEWECIRNNSHSYKKNDDKPKKVVDEVKEENNEEKKEEKVDSKKKPKKTRKKKDK